MKRICICLFIAAVAIFATGQAIAAKPQAAPASPAVSATTAEPEKTDTPKKAETVPTPAPSLQTDQPAAIALSSKVPFKFYGFISAEFLGTDSQLSSFGTLNNTPASYNRNIAGFNRVVDESTEENNDASISATIQNTRFGFALDPYDFNGKNFSVDARLEMDFFSTTNTNVASVAPRVRRAYAGIGQKHWRFLAGHEWDLFSPLNTATINIGGNLWQQGNLGFRRPQLRFTYAHSVADSTGIEGAASLNLPCSSMSLDCDGNTTCIPMVQGRVGLWHDLPAGKMWIYLSGVYSKHNNAVAGQDRVNDWGLALSVDVPVHRYFKPMGEFHYGYSLSPLLSLSADNIRQRTISGWGQIKSEWLSWLETNAGYGVESLPVDKTAANFVMRNQMGFGNILFKPFKVFIIGLEYNYMRTAYKGRGVSEANVGFMNVLFYF